MARLSSGGGRSLLRWGLLLSLALNVYFVLLRPVMMTAAVPPAAKPRAQQLLGGQRVGHEHDAASRLPQQLNGPRGVAVQADVSLIPQRTTERAVLSADTRDRDILQDVLRDRNTLREENAALKRQVAVAKARGQPRGQPAGLRQRRNDVLRDPDEEACQPDWLTDAAFVVAAGAVPEALQTDKSPGTFMTRHEYQYIYTKYLGPYRYCGTTNPALNLLEVGLGPGGYARSYHLYQKFLGRNAKNLRYHAIEWEDQTDEIKRNPVVAEKDKKYLLDNVMMRADQYNFTDLETATSRWGPFDVIIDDGSHMTVHQRRTFAFCFINSLAPGGTYIVEDLQTSFHKNWGGGVKDQELGMTMVNTIQHLIAGLSFHWWEHPSYNTEITKNVYGQEASPRLRLYADVLEWVQTIDCDREICAIRKRMKKLVKEPHARM
jgi:hypothetical protein